MRKSENSSTNRELKDGDDSGAVSDGVRLQVFIDGLGICAAPGCNTRAGHHRTKLAECAHIIPRKVGSHPREDYATPLDLRKQEPNLLYLCELHHKVVDNVANANEFPADLLREWKKSHEEWASSVTKESPYLPNELKLALASMGKSLASQLNDGKTALRQLVEVCRNLILGNRVPESQVLLAQISTLAIGVNDSDLEYEIGYLNARILRMLQNIPESKVALVDLIHSYNTKGEAMAEYVELCRAAPELGDELEETERLLRDVDPKNPHLAVLDLIESSVDSPIPVDTLPSNISENKALLERVFAHNTVILDSLSEFDARDHLLQEWARQYEFSPKPLLFRAIFVSFDRLRSGPTNPEGVAKSIEELNQIKGELTEKAPLSPKDKLQWGYHEFQLVLHYGRITGETKKIQACWKSLLAAVNHCYFDTFVFLRLGELLWNVSLPVDQWNAIYQKVRSSAVIPLVDFVNVFFLKGFEKPELNDRMDEFVDVYGDASIKSLWKYRNDLNVAQITRDLKEKNNKVFTITYIRHIQKISPELSIELCEAFLGDSESRIELLFIKMHCLQDFGRKDQCAEVARDISLMDVTFLGAVEISKIAFDSKHWDLFVHASARLLEVAPTPELNAKLAMAYDQLYDDKNAMMHAAVALAGGEELEHWHVQNSLRILVESLQLKGEADEACRKFEEYASGATDFYILMLGSDAYLKSNLPEREDRALSLVLRAFRNLDAVDEDHYLAVYLPMLELLNSGVVGPEDVNEVADGHFIKVEGFSQWFHLGNKENSMGATPIKKGSDNYVALLGGRIHESIDWPADRFSGHLGGRKIVNILGPEAFLALRSHEAMALGAKSGEKPIWEVKMLTDGGSLDVDNLRKFSSIINKKSDDLFDMYVDMGLPFSFLCANEGSPIQALGKVRATGRGLIKCNNGTAQQIDEQEQMAQLALGGARCYLDGFSALVLMDSDLLLKVCSAIPEVGICTSVIRLFRKEAKNLEASRGSVGRAAFVEHRIKFYPKDDDAERSFRDALLESANYLDDLPSKRIGKPFERNSNRHDWNKVLPGYVVDPLRNAQAEDAILLTDDAILRDALTISGESNLPRSFSSLAIVRLLAERGEIEWQTYLKFFGRLSNMRFFLLPIGVDELMKAVLEPLGGGLVRFNSSNLELLNLGYTLSREYGVSDQSFVGILGQFFARVVKDESISVDMADEIFSVTLIRALNERERFRLRYGIFSLCKNVVSGGIYLGPQCARKLEVLRLHVVRFSGEFDPLLEALPGLIRVAKPQ